MEYNQARTSDKGAKPCVDTGRDSDIYRLMHSELGVEKYGLVGLGRKVVGDQ